MKLQIQLTGTFKRIPINLETIEVESVTPEQ